MCQTLIRQAPELLLVRKKTLHKEIKILLMYFVMYLVFVFLCIPYFSIRLIVDIFIMKKANQLNISTEMIEAFVLMRYFVSAVNPFMYTLYKQDFRRTIQGFRVFEGVRDVPSCSRRPSRFPECNETLTREVSASLGTPMTFLGRSRSDLLKLTEYTSGRLLLPTRSTQHGPYVRQQNGNESVNE